MKYELKDFQVEATRALLDKMLSAGNSYYRDGNAASCCLAAPTGSGKTVMVAAAVEALFNGNPEWGIERDPFACVLWLSDSPSLNEQTILKFKQATDLDPSLIETIENTFTGDHDELEPGHIYFLNRQKLSKAGLLTKGGETPTFWELLRRTVNDPSVHLYMLFDEAHKGLSKKGLVDGSKEEMTVTDKVVDGEDGKTPMPVVVGISATPKRFNEAMKDRIERVPYPPVKVRPADVQASGLLKDKIVLQAPAEGAAVYGIYLADACRNLDQSTRMWEAYCESNKLPAVRPLMVVQVKNNVTKDELRQLCSEIYEKLEWLDRSSAFAHVISGMSDLHLEPYEVPYIEPQDVQRNSDIRVLFAKEAISTGWDCPRAEVIFSLRPHKDHTYISQLIGRMVRTPLAQSADIELLNSVSCLLPYFDPETLDKVVKYLTDEGADDGDGISRDSGREVVKDPVYVEFDDSFGVGDVFTGIASRERAHSTADYIDGLLDYTGQLDENDIGNGFETRPQEAPLAEDGDGSDANMASVTGDGGGYVPSATGPQPDAVHEDENGLQESDGEPSEESAMGPNTSVQQPEQFDDGPSRQELAVAAMLHALNDALAIYADEFEVAKDVVLHAKSQKSEFQMWNPDSVKSNVYEDDADDYAVNNAKRRAEVELSPSVTNAYFRQEVLAGRDPFDINLDIAAAAAVPEIVEAVKQSAKDKLDKLTEEYDPVIAKYPSVVRNKFSSGMSKHGIPHTVFMDRPVADKHDKTGKAYPKHVVNDPKTHKAWFKLYDSEDAVVMHELKRPGVICWYRNPVGKGTGQALRIPYRLGDDRKVLYPDFIFFEKVDGHEMPAIVDPHGLHLSDTMPKLKGVANYVEDFGEMFSRYWFVSDYKGKATYIDMKDPDVRATVREASDAYECFAKHGRPYMEGPLSKKGAEGYRAK